jgi:hypothetical protein
VKQFTSMWLHNWFNTFICMNFPLKKCDLKNGYHQLKLSKESRNITTFTTHVGLRRYKRLSFEISSAAKIFQNTPSSALEGLDGVRNISDDIMVFREIRNKTSNIVCHSKKTTYFINIFRYRSIFNCSNFLWIW